MFKKTVIDVSEELNEFYEDSNSDENKIKLLLTFKATTVGYSKIQFTVPKVESKEVKHVKVTDRKHSNNKKGLF